MVLISYEDTIGEIWRGFVIDILIYIFFTKTILKKEQTTQIDDNIQPECEIASSFCCCHIFDC